MPKTNVITKCQYIDVCYLAEALQCYGYKLDCALYTKSTGGKITEPDFHAAVDALIDKSKLSQLQDTEKIFIRQSEKSSQT